MINIYFLDQYQRDQIGFTYVINQLEVITPLGDKLRKNIKPFNESSKHLLIDELNNIESIINNYIPSKQLFKNIERLFCKIKDISNSLIRCENGSPLDDVELFEIKNFALVIYELRECFNELNLELHLKDINFISLEPVINLLDPEGKKLPTFHIYDKYSDKLKEIRNKKRSIEKEIFTSSDETSITSLKEKRLNYVVLEEDEELNIRKSLSNNIKNYIDIIRENIRSAGKLDFLIAKSKLAITLNGSRPTISDSMYIKIIDGVNPEVASILKKKSKIFTPVTIEIASGTTVITGANMGGKSITLKTLVLNILLTQMGFFVFCNEAAIPLLDFIYFISDDLQSVHQGLSTFGAEIMKLKQVLAHSKNKNGLITLDEFARGTNPKEGSFLVKSLCKYLNKLQSISLISTHYDNIVDSTMVHYQVVGLKHLSFDSLKKRIDLNKTHSIEIIQDHMNYRLERVSKENNVPKDALNICILLGLEEEIIEIAKNLYNQSLEEGD